ncbi:hypothetical protein Emed_003122 [Eimeria media]
MPNSRRIFTLQQRLDAVIAAASCCSSSSSKTASTHPKHLLLGSRFAAHVPWLLPPLCLSLGPHQELSVCISSSDVLLFLRQQQQQQQQLLPLPVSIPPAAAQLHARELPTGAELRRSS